MNVFIKVYYQNLDIKKSLALSFFFLIYFTALKLKRLKIHRLFIYL